MEQAKNLRYKRTLFVGLGGAGAKTLRIVKEQIKKANGGEIPRQVKFLLVDTNATDLANYRDFDCSEKVCIAVREPYQRYKHDKDVNVPTHKYVPKQNVHSLLALERGAGQIRSNGHFAVIENQYSNKLVQVFRHVAEELEDIDVKGETLERDPKIEVRLVFSIAGGTGSGTFLPISLLLRSAIKHSELTAYMYSATHYERIVEKSAKYSVMQNAYASLCELDYMMHFGLNNRYQEPIQFNFGPEENQWITQSSRPFEEVYYIDKITSLPTPDTVEFAYNEIDRMQKNTADALFLAATNIISSHTGTIDNVRQKVMEGQFDVNDKFAWVSGLGMAELYLCPQGITASKVVAAGNVALLARTGDCEIDNDTRNSIVSAFMKGKWDESKGDDDGDPILTNFLKKEEIERACRDILVRIRKDSDPYHMAGVDLDRILQEKAKPLSASIIKELKETFSKDLQGLVKKMLDEDGFGIQHINKGAQGEEFGISLITLKTILEGIVEILSLSKEKLEGEQKEHFKNETDASSEVDAFITANTPNAQPQQNSGFWKRVFGGQQVNPPQQHNVVTNYAFKLAEVKAKALHYRILAERDGKAIEVLDGCIKETEKVIRDVELWQTLLKAAYEFGLKQKKQVDKSNAHVEKKENRVEVQLLEVEKFRLSYEDISKIAKERNKNSVDEGQSIFETVCSMISAKTGDLRQYLLDGVKQRKESNENKRSQFNKEQRTPFQKSIDRLIDLSTPTMQIDGHGFGDRVKADQFWYVMTDCGEDETAESREHRRELKCDSVGGLLKEAIEQNTLDERVNLVHVSGWKNKALLYRVIAAVPPYFVEGVCSSDCGGITLESCYEELKKTKRTYTPFSHETLQKKLENGRCVLKPHEATTDDVALEHWVNFMIHHIIEIKDKESRKGKVRGLRGIYTIASESLGEYYTGDVVEPTKILMLGDDTRVESFNMFARYCNALTKENEEYNELINPLQNPDFKNEFILTPEEYMDRVLEGYYHFRKKDIDSLAEDDSDKELIRKEMALLRLRKQKYEENENSRKLKKDIFDSHISSKGKEKE